MDDRLEQVARGRDEAKAEVVRAALRAFLDEQEDVIGSRKHFTKAFGRRVDHVERLLSVTLWLNLQTLHLLYERLHKEQLEAGELLADAIREGVDLNDGERVDREAPLLRRKPNRQRDRLAAWVNLIILMFRQLAGYIRFTPLSNSAFYIRCVPIKGSMMSSLKFPPIVQAGAKRIYRSRSAGIRRAWLERDLSPLDGKRPALKSWIQYQRERADMKTIRAWTFGNVGIVCGAVSGNLVVLDLDGLAVTPLSPRPFPHWRKPIPSPAVGVLGGTSISTPISYRRASRR